MNEQTVKVNVCCTECNGTGLYQGFAEKDGCAVVCNRCDGAGCITLQYVPFVKKRLFPEGKIKRVFKSTGYFHRPDDFTDRNGKLACFSQGGCTYQEWLNGVEPKPVKDLYCPCEWTDLSLQNNINNLHETRCEGGLTISQRITDCRYYPSKNVCWKIYEEGGGK